MPKLTAELIEQSAQFTNALKEREIDLRGYKIPVIENLGATLDQFDTIDLSDNDLRKLDGFPLLRRLKCLLLNNNRICRIAEGLEKNLPRLDSLILTNNMMQELGDLDTLATVQTLTTLSLLRNPLTSRKHYRLYVIHKLPQVRVLDFRKVRQKEKESANHLFRGKKGQQLSKDLGRRSKSFVPGAPVGAGAAAGDGKPGPSPQDYAAIKAAIISAKSLDEVERLNHLLKSGQVPGATNREKQGPAAEMVEEDEDEEEEDPVDQEDQEDEEMDQGPSQALMNGGAVAVA